MSTTTNDIRLYQPSPMDPTPSPKRAMVGTARLRRTLLRFIGLAVVLVAAVGATGATYEAMAGLGDSSAYPPAGRLVDVGGHRLHIDCRGEGSPTVVMDAGLGGSSLDWALVQSEVAATTRVCTYDRAGMGWSEPTPSQRSPGAIAEELHVLIENAGVPGPYVMVGHSLGGKNVRMFARAHPEEVAGMVLVDARSEEVDARISSADADAFAAALNLQATAYSLARGLGIARLFGAAFIGEPLVAPAIASEMALLQTQPRAIDATTREGLARAVDDAALATSGLGSIPLVVIAAEESMKTIPNWPSAQQSLAALSTSGRLVVAQGTGHFVQVEAPDVVIDSVLDVVARVRGEP